jgi:hypothetical protein
MGTVVDPAAYKYLLALDVVTVGPVRLLGGGCGGGRRFEGEAEHLAHVTDQVHGEFVAYRLWHVV